MLLTHSLTNGGAERVASLWAKGFSMKGHEVFFVLCCKKNICQTYSLPIDVKKTNIYNSFFNKIYRWFGIDFFYVFRLSRIIKKVRPDVIIGVTTKRSEWARKSIGKMKIPIINTEHNALELPDYADNIRKINLRNRFVKYGLYDYNTVLTLSDIKCLKNVSTSLSVLPNPLTYSPIQKCPAKEKIILAAGRLNVWHIKGFDLLIKAWGKISDEFPDWRLQIAGGDRNGAQNFLQGIAKECGVSDQIDFLGFQNDILPIYQRSSIFVLSSRYEGFGMVLIEAMSQGCAPVVCDYKGRQREIIVDNSQGIICPVDDVEALAFAIKKMIINDDYRKMVQQNAIERSKYYSLDNTIKRWDLIFEELGLNRRYCK